MKSLRSIPTMLMATLLLGAAGCRTAGVNDLGQKEMFPIRTNESAAELLVEHNRNAERITSLEAKPAITVADRRMAGKVDGRLAFERTHNFKLELESTLSKVADIGSNDQEFWIWFKDSPEKAIYFCDYDESGASPLAGNLQPDWIIEALGLRVISDEEAAKIKVAPGKDVGTLALTSRQKTPRGETIFKETILSESTHRIREHRIYAADNKTLLARASVTDYQSYPVTGNEAVSAAESVILPSRLRLEWLQEKMALDVSLSRVKINSKFSEERQKLLFNEPKMDGFARINLAEKSGVATSVVPASADPSTTVRETMPAPTPRVRLNDPAPLGIDGAMRTSISPSAVASTNGIEAVVSPTIPSADPPAAEVATARGGWRNSLTTGMER